jgi:Leucine-rich repeat (LRR) protein
MRKIFLCGWFLLALGYGAVAQTDSTESRGLSQNPEMIPTSGPLLNAEQLRRQKWFYSMDEAMRDPLNVYKLSLQDKKLKRFPLDIRRFPNLQQLNLSENKITEIPTEIRELANLQILILTNNKIRELPESMKELNNLVELYVGSNRIMEVPAWVGGLGKLRRLDVSFNNLTSYEVDLIRYRLNKCLVTH